MALVAGRLARVGAARRRRAVRKRAESAVETVARDLVVAPLQAELERRQELRRVLLDAGGTEPAASGGATGGRGANSVGNDRPGRHKSTRFGSEGAAGEGAA